MSETEYQVRVANWLKVMTESDSLDRNERMFRFLEESLEMSQASGCTREDALELLDYVFSRPVGEPQLEAGAVLVTLAGLCTSLDIDMEAAGEAELLRNWEKTKIIGMKRELKPEGSPLPQ